MDKARLTAKRSVNNVTYCIYIRVSAVNLALKHNSYGETLHANFNCVVARPAMETWTVAATHHFGTKNCKQNQTTGIRHNYSVIATGINLHYRHLSTVNTEPIYFKQPSI